METLFLEMSRTVGDKEYDPYDLSMIHVPHGILSFVIMLGTNSDHHHHLCSQCYYS